MKKFKLFLILLAFLGLSASAFAQKTYVILPGSPFKCQVDGTEVKTGTIQQILDDYIVGNADGADCIIQFGKKATACPLGSDPFEFKHDVFEKWGKITLTGWATSSCIADIITIKDDISVECKAEIESTDDGALTKPKIFVFNSEGTFTISNGAKLKMAHNQAPDGSVAVLNMNKGSIILNGGEIEVIAGKGIQNMNAEGTVTINGGKITTGDMGIAVLNEDEGTVTVKGGTLETSGTDAFGIYNKALGTIEIIGGLVTANGNSSTAIYNLGDGEVIISGGKVKGNEPGTGCIANSGKGEITLKGGEIYSSEGEAVLTESGCTGKITVSGNVKISSGASTATIKLADTDPDTEVRLEITGGTITNESTGIAIWSKTTFGAIKISGGTIQAEEGAGISFEGDGELTISGGKIESKTASALYADNGKILISKPALLTSGIDNTGEGTIYVSTGGIGSAELEITGGTVENTSDGNAVFSESSGNATISGGLIRAKEGFALKAVAPGKIGITGGIAFAYGTVMNHVKDGTGVTQKDTAVILAWNQKAGNRVYDCGTDNDIKVLFPFEGAQKMGSGKWDKQGGKNGISVRLGTTPKGFITIEGLTLNGQGVNENVSEKIHLYPNPIKDQLKIENGELTIKSVEIYDVFGRKLFEEKENLTVLRSYDLTVLPAGIYLVKIETQAGTVTQKIVKQ